MTITSNHNNTSGIPKLLARAFQKDPWLVQLFGDSLDRKRWFFDFVCKNASHCNHIILTKQSNNRLVAAACLEPPKNEITKMNRDQRNGLIKSFLSFMFGLGFKNAMRFNRYMLLNTKHRHKDNHYYLTCIGVDPLEQGKGYGKDMLNEIHDIVDNNTSATGIGLDTENLNNVAIYEHFGYRLTAVEKLGPLQIYTMFRPSEKSNLTELEDTI